MRQTITERLLRRVVINPATGCWLWTGATMSGYGRIAMPGTRRIVGTHRVSYELFVGPVPDGHELHHLCETKRCCNPTHVHPVLHGEHTADLTPTSQSFINKRKTHCPKGHALPASGRRRCGICHNEEAKQYYREHREERLAYARAYGHP